ncbi:unnamed protein product [[Candida] boidinii]|nr:unnamed protein product [[Candida] boidinii]
MLLAWFEDLPPSWLTGWWSGRSRSRSRRRSRNRNSARAGAWAASGQNGSACIQASSFQAGTRYPVGLSFFRPKIHWWEQAKQHSTVRQLYSRVATSNNTVFMHPYAGPLNGDQGGSPSTTLAILSAQLRLSSQTSRHTLFLPARNPAGQPARNPASQPARNLASAGQTLKFPHG